MNERNKIRVGTASWTIPAKGRDLFSSSGTTLQRYASVFNAVELNSSFYRHHLPRTYQRWSSIVPQDFLFSVKLSKYFTHIKKLNVQESELRQNLDAIVQLREKFGVLLIQLPPGLKFCESTVNAFFMSLRNCIDVPIVCEPRNVSWICEAAKRIFSAYRISKVIADPDPCAVSDSQTWMLGSTAYFRLHGSPEKYCSSYESRIGRISQAVLFCQSQGVDTWCIFDNTLQGNATIDAYQLKRENENTLLTSVSGWTESFLGI